MRKLTSCCTVLCLGLLLGCASNSHPADAKTGSRMISENADEILLPYREPTELNLSPEVRDSCSPLGVGTTRLVLPADGDDDDAVRTEPQLEGLAACLTTGPLAGYPVALLGTTAIPGRAPYPIDGSGRADRVRSLLGRLGVPFEQIITVPPVPEDALDRGSAWNYRVELGPAEST